MLSKINFHIPFKSFTQKLFSCKKAIVGFTSKYNKAKSSRLDKVLKHHTFRLNKYFIILIISSCLLVAITSFYEQNDQQNKQLLNHTISTSSSLNKIIEYYRESLESLGANKLWEKPDLSSEEISKIIKLSKNNRLVNVIWHPKEQPTKAFGISGEVQNRLIFHELFKNDLLHSPPKSFSVEKYTDHNNQLILLMLLKVKDKGYLSLPLQLTSLLDTIYDRLSSDEVIRIDGGNSLYFKKGDKSFQLTETIAPVLYKFSDNLKLSMTPYQFSIGISNTDLISKNMNVIYQRCGLLLLLGSAMILLYNLSESKNLTKLYKKTFAKEFALLQERHDNLMEEKKRIQSLELQLEAYSNSVRIIGMMQIQANKQINSGLAIISDSNETLASHSDAGKEIDLEVIEDILTTTRRITKDLANNIYGKNLEWSKVTVNEAIDEIITLFLPTTSLRAISIKKNIKKLPSNGYIKTSKLMLQQIILNLIGRSIHSSMDDSMIVITIEKIDERILIHIVDQGLGVDEQLLKAMLTNGKNNLPIANFYIDLEMLKRLVTGMGGILEIGKKTTLSLPIDQQEYYSDNPKVITLKMPNWKQQR
ncbi:MAG: ATP-binding protein [Pseudomonadota bacterium]